MNTLARAIVNIGLHIFYIVLQWEILLYMFYWDEYVPIIKYMLIIEECTEIRKLDLGI